MRVQPRQIDGFIKSPDPAVRCILIYGSDATLVSERSRTLFKSFGVDPSDPFQSDTFTSEQIVSDPVLLADAAAAQSLLGGKRLVRVTDVGDRVSGALKQFLQDPPGEAVIILEGKELKRSGSLVKVMEASDYAASIACYEDSDRDRETVFMQMISAAGLKIDNDALDWLSANLDANRGIVRSEMDKLVLAADESQRIDLSLAQSVISGEGEAASDSLVHLAASGDIAALGPQLERARSQDLNEVALVRTIIAHFLRLLEIQAAVGTGKSVDAAVNGLRPKVFFKVVDQLKRQARIWSMDAIRGQLSQLGKLETELKSTGSPGWILVERYLYQMAAIAGRSRRR